MARKRSFITLTDQFCGAGGSSIGATMAGAEVRLAMNHWKLAIETHNTNFPKVDHDCADISAVNPRKYPSTDILLTSPECTNHSLAKGKPRRYYEKNLFGDVLIDPSEERSRATMWDVPRFAEYHDYNIIITENVVDAVKWRMWDAWLSAMHALGYEHEVVYFNSMFAFPTPQSRDRIYVVFWKRGNRKPDLDFRPVAHCMKCGGDVETIQTWKRRTKWGRYKSQYYYRCPTCHDQVTPYHFAAFNAIDWTIEAKRIGDRKTPLKPKTLARIEYGLEQYGRQVMIVTGRYTSGLECRVKDAYREPLPTQPGDASHAVVLPWMVETAHSQGNGKYVTSSADSTPTQTTAQTLGIVAGFLTRNNGGAAKPEFMPSGLDEATGTMTTSGNQSILTVPPEIQKSFGLINPSFIVEMRGTSHSRGIDEPLMFVTSTGSHHAVLSAGSFLSYYYGTTQASGMGDPIHTVTGLDRAALIHSLDSLTVEDLYFRMLHPHEIGKAMAFPKSYVVLGTKREMVKQYGNAVTPPVMEMIIKRCMDTFRNGN
jgi:DNA (cytosine-5)-methyltransferase 1